ncbi:hypothetical protein RFI_01955 [Reticulomyxa filosa]|uniref:Uncharacterized protein n=1 Tax=Reticulomyxa filosa TaxID=46433 RepID=X6PAM8_RETFI|nr:hypothetical protein RFI_01955 [Reticulomyxa filosa]|eukprot:ETO35119.1 hypothetical protein RFI_01955 [Reticulomyxa filosa]
MAGYDKVKDCQLYQVDPSGAWWAWKASAIGKHYQNAIHFLEKRCVHSFFFLLQKYAPDLGLEDAIHIALLTIKEGFDGDLTNKNIQLGVVRQNATTKKWGFSDLNKSILAFFCCRSCHTLVSFENPFCAIAKFGNAGEEGTKKHKMKSNIEK